MLEFWFHLFKCLLELSTEQEEETVLMSSHCVEAISIKVSMLTS